MNKILLVFDYFKEAFHLNKQNKALYTPQFALIAVRVLLIIFAGVGVYNWIGIENINKFTSMQSREILKFFLSQGLKVLALILVYSFAAVVIEAGLLNMYKKAVTLGSIERGSFREGVSKYFLRLLAGEILIAVCYALAIPFYLIIGLATLTVGLTVIPLLAGVFLTMWKVSLVMSDKGIFEAVGDSFGFAKRNFMPLTFLQIIHWAFVNGMRGGGSGGGGNFNVPSNAGNLGSESFLGQPGTQAGLEQAIRIVKIVVAVLIPVAALATIGASIIIMIFEVFFSLALFVAYKNGFKVEEVQPAIAEVSDLQEEPAEDAEAQDEEPSQNIDTGSDNEGNEEVEQ